MSTMKIPQHIAQFFFLRLLLFCLASSTTPQFIFSFRVICYVSCVVCRNLLPTSFYSSLFFHLTLVSDYSSKVIYINFYLFSLFGQNLAFNSKLDLAQPIISPSQYPSIIVFLFFFCTHIFFDKRQQQLVNGKLCRAHC